MLGKVSDDAKKATARIASYRSSTARDPADLFDIYLLLESQLRAIEMLDEMDFSNGKRNQKPLTEAHDAFIKLTDVWFTGEMRETVRSLAH